MFGSQHNPKVSAMQALATLQVSTVDTAGTIDFTLPTLDLGTPQRKEIVQVTCLLADPTAFNVAFIRVQESDRTGSGFTEIAVLPFKAGIQYVSIQRKQRYLKLVIDTLTAVSDAASAGFAASLIQ